MQGNGPTAAHDGTAGQASNAYADTMTSAVASTAIHKDTAVHTSMGIAGGSLHQDQSETAVVYNPYMACVREEGDRPRRCCGRTRHIKLLVVLLATLLIMAGVALGVGLSFGLSKGMCMHHADSSSCAWTLFAD